MANTGKAEKLNEVLDFLRTECGDEVSVSDVCRLAEIMIGTTRTFFNTLDTAVYREIKDLADYIANAKQEIAKLQGNEMHDERIPDAGRQLDAIVKSTEEATHTIMEQAEAIMAADPSDQEAYQATVNDAVMEIFQACSFQDLTGQRISKVVETLDHIDARVSTFVKAVNARDEEGYANDSEKHRAKFKEDQLINGPALDGDGIDQSIVDGLFD